MNGVGKKGGGGGGREEKKEGEGRKENECIEGKERKGRKEGRKGRRRKGTMTHAHCIVSLSCLFFSFLFFSLLFSSGDSHSPPRGLAHVRPDAGNAMP